MEQSSTQPNIAARPGNFPDGGSLAGGWSNVLSFPQGVNPETARRVVYLRRRRAANERISPTTLRQMLPQYWPLPMLISLGFVGATVFRISALALVDAPWSSLSLAAAQYLLLSASTLYVLSASAGGRVRGTALLLPLAAFLGVLTAGASFQAAAHWLGWGMLFLAVGPLVQSDAAVRFRENLWRTWRLVVMPLAAGSCFAYFTPVGHMGQGFFSGLTTHSMLLGPMAAIAGVSAIVIARHIDTRLGLLLFVCSLLSCVMSGSRSAMGCGLAAWVTTFVLSGDRKAGSIVLLAALSLVLGLAYDSIIGAVQSTGTGQYLEQKGLRNTRTELWEARINEFKAHPLFGVGIGMAARPNAKPGDSDSARVAIEPGSSWLAMLSMTGIAGTGAFVLLALPILAAFLHGWGGMPRLERAETTGILVFLVLHAVFEGYALAFGGPMSLIYWLAWGRAADISDRT